MKFHCSAENQGNNQYFSCRHVLPPDDHLSSVYHESDCTIDVSKRSLGNLDIAGAFYTLSFRMSFLRSILCDCSSKCVRDQHIRVNFPTRHPVPRVFPPRLCPEGPPPVSDHGALLRSSVFCNTYNQNHNYEEDSGSVHLELLTTEIHVHLSHVNLNK